MRSIIIVGYLSCNYTSFSCYSISFIDDTLAEAVFFFPFLKVLEQIAPQGISAR